MKYVGLLVSSICVTLVVLVNFYYNSITLDMQKMEDYVMEINIISEEVIKNSSEIDKNKKEYVDRLVKIKDGIKSSKTSFLVCDYKEYKIKSIDSLIKTISKNEDKYLNDFNLYSKLGDDELEGLINKKFVSILSRPSNRQVRTQQAKGLEVTYLFNKAYI
ncbi:hypothetical protein [Asaccharospora irregularis]|uniref:Uncharacterized protein n=1 Tax=Asaccharospora irregularis DSM 2635 TaxID=1121321 RepID=A0A1M5PBP8_9FIRM|nr:hypothetical protein [Asaccharospora irregularis]SHG98879.1 hypothetical protein SAMN04488530_11365 [Asaccharospora irregularis DSM 2635]